MIPFVAAGGLLIALGFLLAGYQIALGSTFAGNPVVTATHIATNSTLWNLPDPAAYKMVGTALPHGALFTYLGALLFALGAASFSFLVPALAGYIAYAIADRPGIAPGFVMGFIANTVLNAGFLGGIVGGVLAGLVAYWLAERKVPAWMRGLMPVMIIPLGATLVAGFVMVALLGQPLAKLMSALTDGLNSLNGGSAVVLGAILGLMMAFDMGGPLNKTAYTLRRPPVSASRPPPTATPRSCRSWPPSCSPAWSRRWRSRWPPSCGRTCSPRSSGRTARRPGCWGPRSSPRARSRSRRRTRCG